MHAWDIPLNLLVTILSTNRAERKDRQWFCGIGNPRLEAIFYKCPTCRQPVLPLSMPNYARRPAVYVPFHQFSTRFPSPILDKLDPNFLA